MENNEEVFKEKRKPKGEIKFKLSLNEEQKVSNKIHQLTLRGGANFLVCSPTVATVLESIPGFASNSNGDVTNMEYAFGVQKTGQINNRYTVYVTIS